MKWALGKLGRERGPLRSCLPKRSKQRQSLGPWSFCKLRMLWNSAFLAGKVMILMNKLGPQESSLLTNAQTEWLSWWKKLFQTESWSGGGIYMIHCTFVAIGVAKRFIAFFSWAKNTDNVIFKHGLFFHKRIAPYAVGTVTRAGKNSCVHGAFILVENIRISRFYRMWWVWQEREGRGRRWSGGVVWHICMLP